ncbi:MAG: dockerin type I repeat-containing protein, partial [Thermodesulfobacteriota bacterium]|nr:dockerin type I repeat-containing protein [Thermodesulfobacteriota bacterium]
MNKKILFKKYMLLTVPFILLLIHSVVVHGATQSSENYSMRQCTLTNAGGQSSSDNYTLSHILAQPSPISSSSSSGYRLYGGFRHSTKAVTDKPDGDVAPLGNRDGKVNVGDALVALRFALLLETPTTEDVSHGDVAPLDASGQPNPDGQITVGDALVILRKALGLVYFGEFQLEGRILFGNKVITEYTSNNVTFWFRDETAGTSIDNAFAVYDNQIGTYMVSGLPNGPVGIDLSIHETGDGTTF